MIRYFSLRVGLKLFGERGGQVVTNKLTQLHYVITFIPMYPQNFMEEKLAETLATFMFLLEKRYVIFNYRVCAYGENNVRNI